MYLSSFSGGHRGAGGGVATEDTDRGTFEVNGVELDREESRKARVLYDYDAENEDELTIYADQVYSICLIFPFSLCNQPRSQSSFHSSCCCYSVIIAVGMDWE